MSAPLTRYLVSSVRPLRQVISICVANPHVVRGDRVFGESPMGLAPRKGITFRNISTNKGPKFSKDTDNPDAPQTGTFEDNQSNILNYIRSIQKSSRRERIM